MATILCAVQIKSLAVPLILGCSLLFAVGGGVAWYTYAKQKTTQRTQERVPVTTKATTETKTTRKNS